MKKEFSKRLIAAALAVSAMVSGTVLTASAGGDQYVMNGYVCNSRQIINYYGSSEIIALPRSNNLTEVADFGRHSPNFSFNMARTDDFLFLNNVVPAIPKQIAVPKQITVYQDVPSLGYYSVMHDDVYLDGNYHEDKVECIKSKDCVIYCYKGSSADKYAQAYGFKTSYIKSETIGDYNQDGKFNSADAMSIIAAAKKTVKPNAGQLLLSDINGDGSVNSADAMRAVAMAKKSK